MVLRVQHVGETMTPRAPCRYRVLDATRPGYVLGAIIALLLIASCADRAVRARVSKFGDDWKHDRKIALVTHVADGDTIEADFDDPEPAVRVRLLGIDSPELSTRLGEPAKNYTLARCNGKRVTIRLDKLQGTRDKYGRLLAYVYLPNNELLNNALVRDGYAFAYRPKKCDFSSLFETSETQARTAKHGMWKTIAFDDMPDWRKNWMNQRGIK